MKKVTLLGLVILLTIVSCTQEKKAPIEGVWKSIEDSYSSPDTNWVNTSPQPSLFIFRRDYYSLTFVSGNNSRPLMADSDTRSSITDDQVRSIFMEFYAMSGKYDLEDSKLTLRPIVSLWPNLMENGFIEYEYKISNDTLWLTRTFSDGVRHFSLIRLEN